MVLLESLIHAVSDRASLQEFLGIFEGEKIPERRVLCKVPRSKQLTPEQKRTEVQVALNRIKELERKAWIRSQSIIYQTFAGPSERENERKEVGEIVRLKRKIEIQFS